LLQLKIVVKQRLETRLTSTLAQVKTALIEVGATGKNASSNAFD